MPPLTVIAAIGCAAMACYLGKTANNDWGTVMIGMLFAGMAGALLASS